MLVAAREKLYFNLTGLNPKDQDHVFATFAVRVGLEIGHGEASERIASTAIRCHMRILLGIVDSMVVSLAPSEPILAIAAAQALTRSMEDYQKALETLLDELILKGIVMDCGLTGELVVQILFMIARDYICMSDIPHKMPELPFIWTDGHGSQYVRAVTVSQFLQSLLGKNLGLGTNINKECNKLLRRSSQVWLNFTHFIQYPDVIKEVTQDMLFQAWTSGFAVQCKGSPLQ